MSALERSRMLAVASTLIVDSGSILLIQEGKEAVSGTWNLPAGKIEPDETPAEAASRETREEAGITIEPEALIGIYLDDSDVSDDRVVNFVFLATTFTGDVQPVDSDIQDIAWLRPDDAREKDLRAPYIEEAIDDWQNGVRIGTDRIHDLT